MSAPDHRAAAEHALAFVASADDPAAEMSWASEATAHALLALVDKAGEIVEQQKLANVIAAFDAGIEADGHPLEMGSADIHAAIVYLQGRIIDIVNPESENR